MLLDIQQLANKYFSNLKGVLHVGAHFGQEINEYRKLGCKNMLFFEPQPAVLPKLLANVAPKHEENIWVYPFALGNFDGSIEMNVETANGGMSSSLLNANLHSAQYPHIVFHSKVTVDIRKLSTIVHDDCIDMTKYNLMNVDVQGYEMEVFKGAESLLHHIDYIITEVNTEELYYGCPMLYEIDSYLISKGFLRREMSMDGGNWGDALYVRVQNS